MFDYTIVINDNGELKTVTREDIGASIRRANFNAEHGLQQLDFVLNRVLDQRSADEEAAQGAVAQALIQQSPDTNPSGSAA
jgi:hypothetical protein